MSSPTPLPGHCLVVLDPSLMLATHVIPCEDGHAQERSLSPEILDLVDEGDVWVADRNFCTSTLVSGFASRNAFYVIRQHANMTILSAGTLRERGRTTDGPSTRRDAGAKRHASGSAPGRANRSVKIRSRLWLSS